MGLFDKFAKSRGYVKPAAKNNNQRTQAHRSYAAAQQTRLTSTWTVTSQSIDHDLFRQLKPLRARSRDLMANNDYAKKFKGMVGTHVVGPTGFTIKAGVKEVSANGKITIDTAANSAIENHFYKWSKPRNCDVTGKNSFPSLCRLLIQTVARDGEALVRKVYGKDAGPYGFQLQVLAVDRLDIDYNRDLGGGYTIRMGVEINPYQKPIAYHILTKHPGDNFYNTDVAGRYTRVPAEDIYHIFIADDAEQTRGVPWMHSAMLRLQNIGGYEEAAIIAARVGASQMGFFTTPDGNGEAVADGKDAKDGLYTEAAPGEFGVLPEGYDFKPFDPDYPTAMYDPFMKACLRGVASGLNVAYNTLSSDLEGVNFSSIRTGVLEERDNWMVIQNWFIDILLDDVFSEWLRYALLKGAIKNENGAALPAAKYDKFNNAVWKGRRWQWVDPQADIKANIEAVNNRFKSRSDVADELGKDFEENLHSIKAEDELAKTLGVEMPPLVTPNAPRGATAPANTEPPPAANAA